MKTEKKHIKFQANKPFVKSFKGKKGTYANVDNSVQICNNQFITPRVEVKLVNNSQEVYASNRVSAYVSLVP